MRFSKHNIFSRIGDTGNFYIVNPLSGNADILEPLDAEKLKVLKNGGTIDDQPFLDELAEKGYISDAAAEEKLFRRKYLDYIDSRENDEVQIFFVTNYSCNFACSYCYQDQYSNPLKKLSPEIIDAFFGYLKTEFKNRRIYITVFGGEPLLPGQVQKDLIEYFIARANIEGLELSFVTNGYTLAEYAEILAKGRIREIQVTLDGTEKVHNIRRFLKGGDGTFIKIVEGIDLALERGFNINLRMVIDRENITDIPELARFAIEKGWTKSKYFKTQIGRNYELHHCQIASGKLFTRISLYESLYNLVETNPHIKEFYKPAYSIAKFISEQGELPDPLFDSCPACKTEWAFDYTGSIYSCTATVGKSDELLGTFWPVVSRKDELISQWEGRDVTSIQDCKNCNVQLACGGGCGSVAKNRTGSVCSTDCRPVERLLELGFASYF